MVAQYILFEKPRRKRTSEIVQNLKFIPSSPKVRVIQPLHSRRTDIHCWTEDRLSGVQSTRTLTLEAVLQPVCLFENTTKLRGTTNSVPRTILWCSADVSGTSLGTLRRTCFLGLTTSFRPAGKFQSEYHSTARLKPWHIGATSTFCCSQTARNPKQAKQTASQHNTKTPLDT